MSRKVMHIVKSSLGPVFYADVDRALTDAVKRDDNDRDWLPANQAAEKLCRCVECLRDLQTLLDDAHHLKEPNKRRRLKMLLTPLFSLAVCTLDLLNDCESNPETVKNMEKGATKLITQMRQQLLCHVPIGENRLLSKLRNKTSAHVDKSLSANEARQLLATLEMHEAGLWLHVCVCVICDLLKLPVYFWSCASKEPGIFHIMFCEPCLISMRIIDEESLEVVDTHFIKRSPRSDVGEIILRVFENSRWMFRPGDKQIRSFYYDEDGVSWAQSLKNLPEAEAC